jgi:DNA repair exonuclease SbcCD ATPase subunit
MFEPDLIISYVLMGFFFLRQITILKRPNKINYSPLILGIGAIFALVHFILYFRPDTLTLVLKESSSSLLVSLILYVMMNILHQAQKNEEEQFQREFSSAMASKISQMKEYIGVLEDKIAQMRDDEHQSLFGIREDIKNDLLAQKLIQANQEKFIHQFEALTHQENEILKTLQQLPELDQIMHNHIDILRISEQDHFNHIKKSFDQANENRYDIKDEIADVKHEINLLQSMSKDVAEKIIEATLGELSGVILEFQRQLNTLRAQSESVSTSLSEGENILGNARSKSEMLMKQIILSSNNMKTLVDSSRSLTTIYEPIKNLISEIQSIKADYQAAHQELGDLATLLTSTEKEQIEVMKVKVDELSEKLIEKIDVSLQKLHTHYHIASNEVTSTVSELAKKAKLSSYEEL